MIDFYPTLAIHLLPISDTNGVNFCGNGDKTACKPPLTASHFVGCQGANCSLPTSPLGRGKAEHCGIVKGLRPDHMLNFCSRKTKKFGTATSLL